MAEFGGKTPNWDNSPSVLIYNDLAIVEPSGSKYVVALDKIIGSERWATQSERFTTD